MNHEIKKKGSYDVFASINIIQETMKKYPEEIASALIKLAGKVKNKEELISGLAWLSAAAENPLNHDYFRVLYSILEDVAEKMEMEEACNAVEKYDIKYSDCSEGYKYGPDGKQLSNWDPDKDYGNEYVNVHFRIDTVGYEYPNFSLSEEDSKAFDEAIFCVFSALGWECKKKAYNGSCSTWINGNESLYMHPQDFSGVVKKNNVKRIAEALDAAKGSIKLRWVDLFETVFDITDSEYRECLKSQENEIRHAIFKYSETTRRNLYKFQADVQSNVAKKFKLKRVGEEKSYLVNDDLAYKYVSELIDRMVEEEYLVKAVKGDIAYIRAINKTESKQFGLVPVCL